MQHTQCGLQVIVGKVTVIAVHDVNIAEADAGDVDGGVFRYGLGSRFDNCGGVVDIADGDACRIAGRRKRRAAATAAGIGRATGAATELIPGVIVKAGGLAVLAIGQEAHAVGAFEQQRGAVGYAAKSCPASTRGQFVLPHTAGRWAVDSRTVNGDAHADGLWRIAQAAVVEGVHIGHAAHVARNSTATGTADQGADQIATVGSVIFGDATQHRHAID